VTLLVSVMSFLFTQIYPTILTLQSSRPSHIPFLTVSPAIDGSLPAGAFKGVNRGFVEPNTGGACLAANAERHGFTCRQ